MDSSDSGPRAQAEALRLGRRKALDPRIEPMARHCHPSVAVLYRSEIGCGQVVARTVAPSRGDTANQLCVGKDSKDGHAVGTDEQMGPASCLSSLDAVRCMDSSEY